MQHHLSALREIDRWLDALGGDGGMQRHLSALREIDRRLDALGPWFNKGDAPKVPSAREVQEQKAEEQRKRIDFSNRQAELMAWARGRGCECYIIEGIFGCTIRTPSNDEARVQVDEDSGGWMRVSIKKKAGLSTSGGNGRVSSCKELENFLVTKGFRFS
jgi:hypothetical protein